VLTHEEFITVDPGPFTLYYTKALMERDVKKGRYYYLVGSVTDTTFKQLKKAYEQPFFNQIYLDAEKLLNDGTAKNETERVLKEALNSKDEFTIISTTDPNHRKILNLHDLAIERNSDVDAISKIINVRLAELLAEIIEKAKDVKGIFTSGGDVTFSFLSHAGAKGIKLEQEVFPLCVYGKVVEGKYDGLNMITKGGMQGDENAYITIKNFLEGVRNYAK
ncbi:MAG: nucleotide-binding domain containing protein, partial [Acholeplasmataceae bacterium]|nr:nucleotide-binding domain containing protein [Acholeplasmataceae bacterium]